ncbi:hypothetical protein ACGFNX_11160 [Streptomyces sp. NPDC048723]
MKGALQRVEDIAAFQLGRPKPERTPEPQRTAMLTAVMRQPR